MTLELYHHGSSACAAKVRFALAEKRLPWTSRYVDILKGEQFAPEFVALNPKAVVPVLAPPFGLTRTGKNPLVIAPPSLGGLASIGPVAPNRRSSSRIDRAILSIVPCVGMTGVPEDGNGPACIYHTTP